MIRIIALIWLTAMALGVWTTHRFTTHLHELAQRVIDLDKAKQDGKCTCHEDQK